MPTKAAKASERETGERKSSRGTKDDTVEAADWQRKYNDVMAELTQVKNKRNDANRTIARLSKKLEEYQASTDVAPITTKQALSTHAKKFAVRLKAYRSVDRAKVMVAALQVASKDAGRDLREDILLTKGAKKLRKALFKVRDAAILKHLKEKVFTAEAFSLLRLITKLSKRECGMVQQAFKHERLPGGKKARRMLAPDSAFPAPEIFSLPEIVAYEAAALRSTGLDLKEHADQRGADVSGKPYALDRVIMSQLEQDGARYGGMATQGTEEDPHIWLITGDGAGLSRAEGGVRVGLFAGSTELLSLAPRSRRCGG